MKVKFTMRELLTLADSYTLDLLYKEDRSAQTSDQVEDLREIPSSDILVLHTFLSRVNWRAGGRWHWLDCSESELRAIHLWASYNYHTVGKVQAVARQILRRSESRRPLGWMRAIVLRTNVGPLLLDP
jgi:hypothetical protein